MATETLFRITDSVTNIIFADGAGGDTNYVVEEDAWAPAVSGFRISELGGRGAYEEVVEEFTCFIKGTSAANCLANIRILKNLLDRADRWARDEAQASEVSTQIVYSPKGGTVSTTANPLDAVILGRVPGDVSALTLPPDFELMAGTNFKVPGIRIRFRRQGHWNLGTEVQAISAATDNGSIASITFASAPTIPSVIRMDITNFVPTDNTANNAGAFVAVVDKLNGIVIVEAAPAGGHADFTTFNDGNQQTGANILRFTPSATVERETGAITTGSIANDTRRVAVFAVVRNNSSTTTFQLRVKLNSNVVGQTPQITILPFVTAAAPHWRSLGIAPLNFVLNSIVIQTKASAASGSMDIDRIVLVDVTDITSNILALPAFSSGTPTIRELRIDHRSLTRISPLVEFSSGTAGVQPWQGSPFFYTTGTTIYGILMATSRIADNKWRQESAVPALLQNVWTVNRMTSLLTPE